MSGHSPERLCQLVADDHRLALVGMALVFRVAGIYGRWREQGGPTSEDWALALSLLDGDVLADEALFGDDREVRSEYMRRLAAAVAFLSTAPGGVHVFGHQWCWGCHDPLTGVASPSRCRCGVSERVREGAER